MKSVAIVFAGIVLALQWPALKCERADAKFGEFYAKVASANFAAARQRIDEAIDLWPSNARYYAWRAYCTSQGQPSQCSRNVSTERVDGGTLDRQAAEDAIQDYHHALRLNYRDAVARHNLAWLEHLLGEDGDAAKDWREASEIDPDNAVLHLSYGMFLEEGGDASAAKEQYEAAIELTPSILDSPFFTRYRSRSREAADLIVTHCIASIESRLEQGDDPILDARLGKLYLYSGNLDRSARLLEHAAAKLPNLPLVWLNLGELHELRNNMEQAVVCYKKAATIDGSLAGAYLHLGEISLRAGQKNTAARDFRLSIQQWQRVKPITAAHNNRLYMGPRQQIDDLLPTTLVWYTTRCEASRAWRGLAQLFPDRKEYSLRAQTCEQLPSPHADYNLSEGANP